MPSGGCGFRRTRRSVLLAVAFFCAGAARGQSLPASQPASAPADEPLAAVRQRLARVQPRERAPRDHALLAALDFALAVGRKDATQALRVVDAVGYQPLPLAGELPDPPERPLLLAALERQIGFLQPLEVGRLPSAVVAVRTPRELRAEFPGVATWMLPQDWAVVFQPAPEARVPGWLREAACVVVRMRGERATVLGGNLVQALVDAAEAVALPGEEK